MFGIRCHVAQHKRLQCYISYVSHQMPGLPTIIKREHHLDLRDENRQTMRLLSRISYKAMGT